MEEITEKEANDMIKENKEEIKEILESGGKVTKTIIREKDKTTVITKIEPVEGKSTSSKIVIAKDEIIINS